MKLAAEKKPVRLDVPSPRHSHECPVEDWLAFLGHRWNALILWHLKDGPRRHNELISRLRQVTPKVLAERLNALEQRSLVVRSVQPTFPRTVHYDLSAQGRALVDILDQIELWAKRTGT